jgi:HAD domain in Swiss Army Knife RNA repair proteins
MRRAAEKDTNSLQRRKKPVLLVDIDGVLSLFGFPSEQRPAGSWINVDGIVHLISATASEHLHRLAHRFELVWCSGWEEKANDALLADLRLPDPLPFLTFSINERASHWKLPAITAYVGGRPLAWVDDAHDDASRAWARERDAPTLLVETDPATGLTAAHVAALERWADAL